MIDPAKVGFFGFSLGGATGLVLMETKPDFARVASLCKETTGSCAQLHNGETPPEPIQDSRIRAAVIVDPAPGVLTRENLTVVKVPFQFWRSQFGGPGVGDGSGTARVAEGLPGKARYPRRARRPLRVPRTLFGRAGSGRAAHLHRRARRI